MSITSGRGLKPRHVVIASVGKPLPVSLPVDRRQRKISPVARGPRDGFHGQLIFSLSRRL
jgi:hypothetical protein